MFINLQRSFMTLVRTSVFETPLRLCSTMNNPVVTIKQGKLRGVVDKLYDGSIYYSFKGVPYAKPPIGPLRFKAPQPPEPWSGVLDAIEHGPVCPQIEMQTLQIEEGDENCLLLNIYTKSLQPDSKLPVMVYIHGGAYMSGSGDSTLYGPKFLLQHDVILVTINYRLELLGFLCLDTPEVPGNAGLKDQVAALRWVRNNIKQFGGDPDNVTLFGESAGGSSVSFHLFSPMSTGLFHRVIAQSGVCITDWAYGVNAKERAFRVGKLLGTNTEDAQELIKYFRGLPASKLVGHTMKTMSGDEKHRGLAIHFAPVVEKKFDSNEAFLEESPLKLLLEGKFNKVPMIVGYNSAEGIFLIKFMMKKLDFNNKHPSYYLPREVALMGSKEKMIEFGQRIKSFYVDNRDFATDDVNELAELLTDTHFMYNAQRFSHFYSLFCKTIYMYRFDCVTELNFFKHILGNMSYRGASHVDEIFYMFSNNINNGIYEEHQNLRDVVFNVTKLWTDFAKTGNPTPDSSLGITWSPFTPTNKEYLSIEEQLSLKKHPDGKRMEFWNKIYADAGCPHITKSNL